MDEFELLAQEVLKGLNLEAIAPSAPENPEAEWANMAQFLTQELAPKVRAKAQELAGHDLSKYLHGHLLKRIIFTAQKITKYQGRKEFALCQKYLNQLILEFTVEKFREGSIGDEFRQDFYELTTQAWNGLLAITFDGELDFYLQLNRDQKVAIVEVVDEVIMNASRHGVASKITITFKFLSDRELSIQAVDNGAGVKEMVAAGLGSQLFNSATNNRWSLSNHPEGGCVAEFLITTE